MELHGNRHTGAGPCRPGARAAGPRSDLSPSPHALSLDVWGTLIGSDPAFKPARNELLRAEFAPGVTPAQFDTALRGADRAADETCMTTGLDVGFDARVCLALQRLAVRSDTVPDRSAQLMARQTTLAMAHPPRPLAPELPTLVAAAARRMPIVLTSNTGMLPGVLMRDLLRLAGFDVDDLAMVFSNEVGAAKPAREIFDIAVRAVGVPAAQVLHVGDNPVADVQGGADAGLQTLLVAPDGIALAARLREIIAG
ncbi:MAG: HAD family hydrolase [Allobranchiibius sp.]